MPSKRQLELGIKASALGQHMPDKRQNEQGITWVCPKCGVCILHRRCVNAHVATCARKRHHANLDQMHATFAALPTAALLSQVVGTCTRLSAHIVALPPVENPTTLELISSLLLTTLPILTSAVINLNLLERVLQEQLQSIGNTQ